MRITWLSRWICDVMLPVTEAKNKTPILSTNSIRNRSKLVEGVISPYPTVDTVVRAQYTEAT